MGCKPAALFPLGTAGLPSLRRVLPPNIRCRVIREGRGRALLFLFDRALLEDTIFHDPIRQTLTGMGYPSRLSLPLFLTHLQKQFNCGCPHEVGLFLGYPLEDVLGFIKNRGSRYKLCGPWKVYGDVEQARNNFRKYDFCREYMRNLFGRSEGRVVRPFTASANFTGS
jgi:hypothetical protein